MKIQASLISAYFLLLSSKNYCHAVLRGDELYRDYHGGNFWAFHSAGVSIVNPKTCRIQQEIRRDIQGQALPEQWNDGVYMEYSQDGAPPRSATTDPATVQGYIIINSGVDTYDPNDLPMGELLVFSRETNQVVKRIPFQGGRVHRSYGVYTRNEFWMATQGKLRILKLESLTWNKIQLMEEERFGIPDGDDDSSELHGAILWDESAGMDRHAYVSSNNPVLHIISLRRNTQVALFNYSQWLQGDECSRGAHGMAYTQGRLFLQCGWHGPTLEFDLTLAPILPRFVAKHNISGHLREHEDGWILATDTTQSMVHLLQVRPNNASTIRHSLQVPGQPDQPSILKQFRGSETITTVCMPLTENMNQNNRYPNGTMACDASSCGPPNNPQDVAAGMCLYDPNDDNRTLLRAPLADYDKVMNGEAPYLNRCPRCKIRDSYRGGDICTCTPHCGSCAAPDYNALVDQTGVRCFYLEHLEQQEESPAMTRLIPGAGAVLPEPPRFWQPPCAHGYTHRSSTRGGRYMASVAHLPANSLQIVDMTTEKLVCQVELRGKPDRVIYVPPSGLHSSSSSSSEEWKRSGIITLVVVLVSAIAAVVIALVGHHCRYGRKEGSFKDDTEQTTTMNVSPPHVEEPLSEMS